MTWVTLARIALALGVTGGMVFFLLAVVSNDSPFWKETGGRVWDRPAVQFRWGSALGFSWAIAVFIAAVAFGFMGIWKWALS